MLKKFIGLLTLMIVLSFSAVSAAQLQPVTDDLGLLGAEELKSINQKIKSMEQTHGIKIGIWFTKMKNNTDMITASNNFLDQNFAKSKNGSIVLIVDMNLRKYEMATNSLMLQKITDTDGIPFLKGEFQPALHNGDYYGAANSFVDGVDKLVSYYEKNGQPYGSAPDGIDFAALGGAIIVALLCGLGIRSWLIGSMSNIHHASEATDYLQKNSVNINENRDTYLFKNVTRTKKSSNSSSRGGGGSHGGGGHGGGGGSF
ncbi:MAG: TPM domain-containing protein [Selenomonadaceae bacterium]|nr:TPM domain-containing protein [Selenomonadaceae bacterium]